ncbi:hypothetical protein diail_11943 [Diaporthe ilicicola]|nr:hypothetical protein diail_11943 [Diaporthe ilicicola]
MAQDHPCKPNHLEPSELGTKEYWDNLYKRELVNNASDPADRGTVWFDDSDAEAKLLQFLEDLAEGEVEAPPTTTTTTTSTTADPLPPPHLDKQSTSFLDLGCGNGSLLFALRQEGWRGRCLGVDYSEESVALARQIASSSSSSFSPESGGAGEGEVKFAAWDVLRGAYSPGVLGGAQAGGWDVVHDKGTFDAISLSDEADASSGSGRRRRACEGYKGRVVRLVRPGGLFLVTSCNWTEAELEGWFGEGSAAVEGGAFVRVGRVNYPSFSFGGVKGQTISTLCFQKR